MSKKELTLWIGAHGLILVFLFSILLAVKRDPVLQVDLPLVPKAIKNNWFARNMTATGADQWLYFQESQYILHGRIDPKFLRYKSRSVEGGDLPLVQKTGLRLPYRDISFEYPPLAFLPILIPGIFTSDLYIYRILYSLLASLTYLWTLWIFIEIYRTSYKEHDGGKTLRKLMMASLGFLIFMGPIVVNRLDIFPVLFVALALRAAQKNQAALSGSFLAMGVAAKLYPLVLLPLFFFYWVQGDPRRRALRFISGFAAALGIIYLPVLLIAPQGYLQSLSYHSDRGVEIESVYASFAQIRHVMGYPAEVYSKYGSKNIFWPGEEWVKRYWIVFSLFSLFLAYLHAWTQIRLKTTETSEGNRSFYALAEGCFLLVLALMTFSKVLSVQFVLWLFPLFLWVGVRRKMVFPLVLQIALGTQLIYPFFFTELVNLKKPGIALLLWRNALLVLLFLCLIDWKMLTRALIGAKRR